MKKEEGKPARKYVGQSVCQPAGQPKPEEGRKNKTNKKKTNKQASERASKQRNQTLKQ